MSISRFYKISIISIQFSILALINIVGKNDNVTVIKGPKMNHVVDLLDEETKETLLEESVLVEVNTKSRDSRTANQSEECLHQMYGRNLKPASLS